MSALRRPLLLIVILVYPLTQPAYAEPARGEEANIAGGDRPSATDRHGDPLPPGARARLGTLHLWQGGAISALAFAPDGKTLVSASDSPTLRLWDAATGKELRQFRGHRGPVCSVAFAPDGKTLASGSAGGDDPTIRIWDSVTGRQLRQWTGADDVPLCLAFAPDGHLLASAGKDGSICFWDPATGKELRQLKGPQQTVMTGLLFSPDGRSLASWHPWDGFGRGRGPGSQSPGVILWDAGTGKRLRKYEVQTGHFPAFAFSADGQVLATGDQEGHVHMWDVTSIEEARRIPSPASSVALVAYAPDGKTLAVATEDGYIRTWAADTERALLTIQTDRRPLRALVYSPDGKTLASGDERGRIRLWDSATGKERLADGPRVPFASIAVAADGQTIFSLDSHTVRQWEAGTGKETRRLAVPDARIECLALSPDGRTVAVVREDRTIRLLESATGKEVRHWQAQAKAVPLLTFSPDGTLLAALEVGEAPVIRLWDAVTGKEFRQLLLWEPALGKEMRQFFDYQTWPSALTFSPDGRTLAAIDAEATVQLWEIATGQTRRRLRLSPSPAASTDIDAEIIRMRMMMRVRRLRGRMLAVEEGERENATANMAVSPNSRLLALGRGETIQLWDLATGKRLRTLGGHDSTVAVVAFSPDGKLLASGGQDETVRLWRVDTAEELCRLRGHRGAVRSLAFSADGKTLVSASDDATALVWDVPGAIEAARQRAPGDQSAPDHEPQWTALLSADAGQAYAAMGELAARPRETVAFLKERLQPAAAVDPRRLSRLLADLDSNRFAAREKAMQELEQLAELAGPALQKMLANQPSPEVRQRVEKLVAKLDQRVPAGEVLRTQRALEVLEQIGTAEARQLLQRLAEGTPEARLTQDVKKSLERLAKRSAAQP
jgi:WD40 repeat protein